MVQLQVASESDKIIQLEKENKLLKAEVEILEKDLQVKYEDFNWSVLWQDEEKSNLPIAQIIVGVLQIITIVIIFIR